MLAALMASQAIRISRCTLFIFGDIRGLEARADAGERDEDVRKEEAADAVPDAGDVLARAEKSYAEERADLQCMHVAT